MNNLIFLSPLLFLIMWSSGAVMVKLGLQHTNEWNFLALRALLSFFFISIAYKLVKKPTWPSPTKAHIKDALMTGLLLQVCYLSFYTLAIGTGMSPGLVTLILGAQPLLVPFIQRINLPISKKMCLVSGFSGLCIAVTGTSQINDISGWGSFFAFLALLSLTFGTIKKSNELHPVTAMVYQCLFSSIVFSIVSTVIGWSIEWNILLLISLVWMSLFVSIGAFLLLIYMNHNDQPDRVSLLFYAVPPVTYGFDYALFGTTLSQTTLLGILLVTISILYYRKKGSIKLQNEESLELPQSKR